MSDETLVPGRAKRGGLGTFNRRGGIAVVLPARGDGWTAEQRVIEEHRRFYIEWGLTISPRTSSPAALMNHLTGAHGLDASGVSASAECEHGRLPGDSCPQPATVPAYLPGKREPNPDRRWPHPHPCGCWPSEAVVRATPDPFVSSAPRITSGGRSRLSAHTPVPLPRVA